MKVGNYSFELKAFKYLESRSEETYCFSAVLYVNGTKLAHCGNDGHGGSTDVRFLPECIEKGRMIETFLRTQPKVKPKGFDLELDFNLEYIVDELVQEIMEERELKKIKNETSKCLVFKDTKGGYYTISWKKFTIDKILAKPEGRKILKKTIQTEMSKGNKLINENIPSELLPQKL